ncbi:hypothetical protein [Methanimicrococcus hongohii]|uniref:hypothetical protein n=1 Tax=Methanimicrococcus hongohii TaxID=3028295 RepID=UPI00292EB63A|nr:hypothetical protein [Methanimicrococcus sp. Hf6]
MNEKTKYRPSIDEFPKRSGGKEEIEILSRTKRKTKNLLRLNWCFCSGKVSSCNCLLLLPAPAEPVNLQLSFNVAVSDQVCIAVGFALRIRFALLPVSALF